jgi:hypothetical protein
MSFNTTHYIIIVDKQNRKATSRGDPMLVRQATLDDTYAIVALFTSRIAKWQRLNEQGQVEDLPYENLTIYERWLHGGAWMTLETGVLWLSHLLSGHGLAYVVEIDDDIVAYAETFYDNEFEPLGKHLYLSQMIVSETCEDDVHHNLADAIIKDARSVGRLTVSYPEYDTALATYYRKYFGANELIRLARYSLNAHTGQSFYKTRDYDENDSSQIEGWEMSIGRLTSPRMLWETEWTEHWKAISEITARKKHRLHINAAGHEAIVCYHQQLYNTRSADVYCWSPKKLSSQLIVAIRDWGHRAGYRTLILALPDHYAKLLPAEATTEPHYQVIASVDV